MQIPTVTSRPSHVGMRVWSARGARTSARRPPGPGHTSCGSSLFSFSTCPPPPPPPNPCTSLRPCGSPVASVRLPRFLSSFQPVSSCRGNGDDSVAAVAAVGMCDATNRRPANLGAYIDRLVETLVVNSTGSQQQLMVGRYFLLLRLSEMI